MGNRLASRESLCTWLALGVPFALSVSACSLLLQTDDTQCATNDDCRKRGAAFSGAVCVANACQLGAAITGDGGADASSALACIGSAKSQPAPPAGNISVTMSFYDPVSPTKRLAGIGVRACAKLDVNCTAPLTSVSTSDTQGNATLVVPAGFDGYLEINGPSTVPALWYFSPLPVADGSFNVGLLSPSSFESIAQTVGASIDQDAGHAFNFALDCTARYGTFTSGMSFASDKSSGETRGFYEINGLPSTTATATDTSGIGGFANLPIGVVTVTATLQSTGVRSGSVSMLIRPGVITYSPIAPGP